MTPAPVQAAADRRQQIVDAAAAVMGRQGYAGTSMKDIAAEAGVAQALIHYYFGTKEDLLAAVVRSLCDAMRGDAAAGLADPDAATPGERIRHALERARRRATDRPELFRLLFDMISLSFSNPTLRAELDRLYRDETESLAETIENFTAEGGLELPLPARDLAAVVIAAVDGLALQQLMGQPSDGAYTALERLLAAAPFAIA